jgi:hypothetical protein
VGEPTEIPGTGANYTEPRSSSPTGPIHHRASKKRGRHPSVALKSYLRVPPNYYGEPEAIEDALFAPQALENCLKSNTRDRRHALRAG